MSMTEWHPEIEPVVGNVSKVIVGKQDVIRLTLTAILAGGHCLIEDVPGVGKTVLIRAIATSLGCECKRIQFTPDLLPSDVTGVSIYDRDAHRFSFQPGPIFAQVVLADEINRTSPRTQSALLQALEEKTVTVDGMTHTLPSPFFVLATENPIDFQGTYPLPEAQLDRFLLKISMGYPTLHDELAIVRKHRAANPLEELKPVVSPADVVNWCRQVATVHMAESVEEYIVRIVQHTRSYPDIRLGASPRSSIALSKAAQAFAFLCGRQFVIPDDVRFLAPHVLAHRIILSHDMGFTDLNAHEVVQSVVSQVPIPLVQGSLQ